MFFIKTIYFDTETTGLDFQNCQIIEFAMFTVENGVIVEEYDEFIKCGSCLPSHITEITGITDDMLVNNGLNEKTVACDLKNRLTSGTLMIAHNAQFDLSFIYSLLKRHFPDDAYDILFNLKWLDTLTVLKDRKSYPHKLCDAVEYYGIDEVNYHRAIDDTKALYNVTQELINERDDLGEYINIFGYNPKYGVSGPEFSFIEYKSQPFNYTMVSPENILPKL